MELNDLRHLKNAFGSFLTGVTVVTSMENNGIPRGFTANSFTSVSLSPPMLLICVDKEAESFNVFIESPGFAVNILSENQTELSALFASKRHDKFDIAKWEESNSGYPILNGICAWFDCKQERVVDAGDHVIIIGKILNYDYNERMGLGYVGGGYLSPGLERSAARAYGGDSHTVVGAIIEYKGKILLYEDSDSGKVYVPASGLNGTRGSVQQFQLDIELKGIIMSIISLFAVFESEEDGRHSIYYRARAEAIKDDDHFWRFDEIPWHRITDQAIFSMLRRYVAESSRQRFGVYFGSDRNGSVKTIQT